MYLKLRLEYAWFVFLSIFDKLKVTVLQPLYYHKYKKSTEREMLDLIGDNPDPSRWDVWVVTTQQNDNFVQRCKLTSTLMEQISLLSDLLMIHNGLLDIEITTEDCRLGIAQLRNEINDTLEQLIDLNSDIPHGYPEWLNSTPIEKLCTRFKINNFIHRAQAKTLYMPFYH